MRVLGCLIVASICLLASAGCGVEAASLEILSVSEPDSLEFTTLDHGGVLAYEQTPNSELVVTLKTRLIGALTQSVLERLVTETTISIPGSRELNGSFAFAFEEVETGVWTSAAMTYALEGFEAGAAPVVSDCSVGVVLRDLDTGELLADTVEGLLLCERSSCAGCIR